MAVVYSTRVTSVGGRNGHVQSDDGLVDLDLAPPSSRGSAKATNPEQLFAAGYAACFNSALTAIARRQGLPLTASEITAGVSLITDDRNNYNLALILHGNLKGLSQEQGESLMATAHQTCPYSNATRGNIDVQISTTASV